MSPSRSDPVILFLVELRCLSCARVIGTLETRRWPWHGPASLRPTAGARPVPVANWPNLRCATCGGNVYADEVETIRVYPRVSWDDLEQPRRGRPPAWLVAQRRAARDADGDA